MRNYCWILMTMVLAAATIWPIGSVAAERGKKAAPVHADPKEHNVVREDGRTVIYKKRNVVDFDDSLIEGEVRNPNEFYFVHRPEEKFGTLVKKRPNFHKEMLRDTVMIR